MGGGILELVAHGVQDSYMIGNPQITFFKIVFKRHTNFSIESALATHEGTADFGKKVVVTLPRKGDLVHTIILEADLPALTLSGSGNETSVYYVNGTGHALIDYIELEIGGNVIDKHYGEWMEIWTQLSYDESKQNAYDTLLPRSNIDTSAIATVAGSGPTTVYIPLQFWFCRNIGLALPLIALQFHDIKLNITFKAFSKMVTFGDEFFTITQSGTTITQSGTNSRNFDAHDTNKTIIYSDDAEATATYASATTLSSSVSKTISSAEELYLKPRKTIDTKKMTGFRTYIDYIYLDTFERKKFAQMSHKYLIEQVQFNENINIDADTKNKSIDLDFNLPIKSIYWVNQLNKTTLNNDNFNFTDKLNRNSTLTDPIEDAILQLNGTDRFEKRKGPYFRLIQPFQRHTRVPKLYIYMYSFCLKPEAHQPTGTCNFSKINSANLNVTFKDSIPSSKFRVYALNYNVLRIFNGMGGIAFSN